MTTLNSIPRQAPNVASRLIDDEAVLVHPVQGKVRVLNSVGTRVWELADGRHTLGQIAAVIATEYDVVLTRAQDDLIAFCDDLASRGVMLLDS